MSARRRRERAWLTYWQKIRRVVEKAEQRRLQDGPRNFWNRSAWPTLLGPAWHRRLAEMRVLEAEVADALFNLQTRLGGWPILSMTTAEIRARWPDEKAPGQS